MLTLWAAITLASCGDIQKPASQGGPYDVLLLLNHENWNGAMGDTLKNIMRAPVRYINQYEPMFELQRILPKAFDGLLSHHRNVLNVRIGEQFAEPSMTMTQDQYSRPQLIVTVSGPDNQTVTQYISDNRTALQDIFNMHERNRYLELLKLSPAAILERQVAEKFGFTMRIPSGYTLRNELDDFLWISQEYPESSQGIIIYSYPYEGQDDFLVDSLLDKRDAFVANIPAENPGSHMITFREIMPEVRYLRIFGRPWAEMRGFWDVAEDFMGGPFVSYSTVDTATNRVVCVDCYVYSPSPYKPKRNLLRQLENLIYSAAFPGDMRENAPAE